MIQYAPHPFLALSPKIPPKFPVTSSSPFPSLLQLREYTLTHTPHVQPTLTQHQYLSACLNDAQCPGPPPTRPGSRPPAHTRTRSPAARGSRTTSPISCRRTSHRARARGPPNRAKGQGQKAKGQEAKEEDGRNRRGRRSSGCGRRHGRRGRRRRRRRGWIG